MPAASKSSSQSATVEQASTPADDGRGREALLVEELIGALRALQPGQGELTSFQQAIIEEHAELIRALHGPYLVSAGPVIANISPESGGAGTVVTISGERLDDATLVRIGAGRVTSFAAESTQITLSVPNGATSDQVIVFTPLGVAASANRFNVSS